MCLTATGGGSDEEDQVGVTVRTGEIDAAGKSREGQRWLGDDLRAAVWNSNASGHAGASLGLAVDGRLGETLDGGRAPRLVHQGGKVCDDRFDTVAEIGVQRDQVCRDEIGCHEGTPLMIRVVVKRGYRVKTLVSAILTCAGFGSWVPGRAAAAEP